MIRKTIEKITKEKDYKNVINAIPYIHQTNEYKIIRNISPEFLWRYFAVESVSFEFKGNLLTLKQNDTYTFSTANKFIFDPSQGLLQESSTYKDNFVSPPPGLDLLNLLEKEDVLKFISVSVDGYFSDVEKKHIEIVPFIYEYNDHETVLEFEDIVLTLKENGTYTAHSANSLISHPFQGKRKYWFLTNKILAPVRYKITQLTKY